MSACVANENIFAIISLAHSFGSVCFDVITKEYVRYSRLFQINLKNNFLNDNTLLHGFGVGMD